MNNNASNNLPAGMDPRILAQMWAQRQLGRPAQHHQQQQPSQQQQQRQAPNGTQSQRPGGDADVASFLLQLKTNQNGEPVNEAEAFRIAQRAAQQLQQRQHAPNNSAPAAPPAPVGYAPPPPSLGHMYGSPFPGMLPFPPNVSNNQFAAMAAAINNMPSVYGHPNGLGSIQGTGVGATSPIIAPQQPLAPTGNAAPIETGPPLTDAYIESLIRNDKEDNKEEKKEEGNAEKINESSDSSKNDSKTENLPDGTRKSAKDDMNIALVVPADRDLIPDALFVALGQMKATRLQQSDRVGCYKTRTIGFLGMCCKHCGGQPGFGRYFPNSVRSLAQTTTSQTILKHIGGKCRFCPPHIRKAILELQRQQAHKEHLNTGRPRYGSRKIFFQRMWARLHGVSEDGESPKVVQSDVAPETAKAEAEKAVAAASAEATSGLAIAGSPPPATAFDGGRTVSSDTLSAKRSLPTEVSNNNTDDEGGTAGSSAADTGQDERDSIVSIRPSLENEGNGQHRRQHHKKRKISSADAEFGTNNDLGDNSNKISSPSPESPLVPV